jgi:hypothetical protein
MVRNDEPWDLGEPEMNARGQPVIHDIASRLGCIRPSPDIQYDFSEEGFAELKSRLQAAARSEMGAEEAGSGKLLGSVPSSPSRARAERASSSESDYFAPFKDYNQTVWAQQKRQASCNVSLVAINTFTMKPTPLNITQQNYIDDDRPHSTSAYSARALFDADALMSSVLGTDFLRSPQAIDRMAEPDVFEPIYMQDGLDFTDGRYV